MAVTETPAEIRRLVTPAQLPASANAPCTSTTVGSCCGVELVTCVLLSIAVIEQPPGGGEIAPEGASALLVRPWLELTTRSVLPRGQLSDIARSRDLLRVSPSGGL